MKRLHKSITAVILLAAVLFQLIGCTKGPIILEDADCFTKFMDAICAFDFRTAYGYLSENATTMPTARPVPTDDVEGGVSVSETVKPEVTPLPINFINCDDFIAKYAAIFDGLGVKSVSYEKLSEETDGDVTKVAFRMTYETEVAGSLTNEYEMRLVTDGIKRRVDWTPALIFPEMKWGYTVKITTVPARRGDILADGKLLAETVSMHAVVADISKIPDRNSFVTSIAGILGISAETVIAAINKAKGDTALLAQINDHELTADMHEAIDRLEGARLIENYGVDRVYPMGSTLAHTIGYVGYVEEADIEKLNEGRLPTDGLYDEHSIVGRSGLERSYETVLRGKDGLNVTIRNGNDEYVSTVYRKPVEHGSDVHLTIDLALQQRAEEVMDLVLWGDNTAGAVIVMDPKTGSVKAMASYPTYDLNKLAISADAAYYKTLTDNPAKPLHNRMTLGLYPPGSSMKSFTASAALELHKVTPSYVFDGEIEDDYWTPSTFGRWMWPPIKRTHVNKRSEPLNMTNAMLHSDNIYFAYLALLMGEDSFLSYLRRIGFEQDMPFELSVARSTLKVKYDSEEFWNTRSIAETGYGQGQVTVSPLQLATMYCAFRNGGNIPIPHVTDALYRTEGVEYVPYQTFENGTWIEGAIKPSTISTLLPMMEGIMNKDLNGTGRMLRARGCTVAGKTGTAEIGSDKRREISWFVGFRVNVSADDELLVLVVLEIPNQDAYAYLKFDIARELISMDE
ncbi:MAG: hypothetical protein K6F68_01745 [Clostridiales bacterium]|nr:hypothetical protein [Clostridiales bacterium]